MKPDMNHNEYIFSTANAQFQFLRRFEDMYRNCSDPHGQSSEIGRVDYQLVLSILNRALTSLPQRSAALRLLDVGCGLGFFTAQLKRSFPTAEVAGCDISPTAVAKAAARAPECQFFAADLKNLVAESPRGYDALVAMYVLAYFTDAEIDQVVGNLRDLLNPGGFFMAAHHLPAKMNFGRFIISLEDARALFGRHGFTVRLGVEMHDELDMTYANQPVGHNLYFLAQKNP